MISYLFILDSLGTSEFLLILVVALIFFGPRKLPQLSRQIGKSLAEFKKASEDFKRTWEREVALETKPEPEVNRTILPQDVGIIETTVERSQAIHRAAAEGESSDGVDYLGEPAAMTGATPIGAADSIGEPAHLESNRKRDWL